ncbi:MAG: glycosyltransferase family 4 protein [Thermoanaerobaculum sp.]|nr:glycosyltransferase family 4 protein [Thermoanaerobaculum sp.]
MRSLRLLVLSNLYPPHYIGGYEVGCHEVVEGLRGRGHEVLVLTSRFGLSHPLKEAGVWRGLQGDCLFARRERWPWAMWLVRKELTNHRWVRQAVRHQRPQLVYVWNYFNISVSNLIWLQRQGYPLVFFVFDNWLASWEADPWHALWFGHPRRALTRLLRIFFRPLFRLLGVVAPMGSAELALRRVQFGSAYLRDYLLSSGKRVEQGEVLHWGIDLKRFPFRQPPRPLRRFLYAGQLVPHKGVHTLLEAFAQLVRWLPEREIYLTVAGGSVQEDYVARLHQLAEEEGIAGKVRFTGHIPREKLPALYCDHDVLVAPFVWDEPLSLVILEAMASGLAVVGTATGGSGEILKDQENGLVFAKGDPQDCAAKLALLVTNAQLAERLRHAGRKTVEERFSWEAFLNRVEASLGRALEPVFGARAPG